MSITTKNTDIKTCEWSDLPKMNRWALEVFINLKCGKTIGWLASCINTPGLSNPVAKLRGLARLAAIREVTDSGYEMYKVNIAGNVCDMKELEKYEHDLKALPLDILKEWERDNFFTDVDPWIREMVLKAIGTR
jgi:hypothetical protein